MNHDPNSTDFRKQRTFHEDLEKKNLNNNSNKKNPKYGTYVDDDHFHLSEPTDKDGNVIYYFLFVNLKHYFLYFKVFLNNKILK